MSLRLQSTLYAVAIASLAMFGACGGPVATTCASCVKTGAPPSLAADLVPESGSSFAEGELLSVDFDGDGHATLTMATALSVAGAVRDALNNPVSSAQVVATRPSLIPGQPLVTTEVSVTTDGEYSLLLPAIGHTLTVYPLGTYAAEYAPQSFPLAVGPDGAANFELRLQKGPALSGKIFDELSNALPNIQVRAVDPDTSAPVSSVATSDSQGNFTIALSPAAASLPLVNVTADVSSLITVVAGMSSVPSLVLSRSVPPMGPPTTEPLELHVPAFANTQMFTLPLSGVSTSGATVPLEAGARVDFVTSLTPVHGDTVATYTVSPMTDDSGQALAQLIPGGDSNRKYSLQIVPTPGSLFQGAEKMIVVGAHGGVLGTQALPLRLTISGKVVDAGGNAVADLTVSLTPALLSDPSDLALPVRATATDGSFVLRSDPGIYDLDLLPPPRAQLARWSSEDIDLLTNPMDLVLASAIQIPAAVAAQLKVVDNNGAPIPGVTVRLYALGCDASSAPCTKPAHVRGEGITGDDGMATILVAAP